MKNYLTLSPSVKNTLKGLFFLFAVCTAFSLASCSDDDDDEDGGGGSSVTSSSLVGKSFKCHELTYSDDGEPSSDNELITFTTSSKCTSHTWGYWYVYYTDSWHEKYTYDNDDVTYSYTVSGSTIKLTNSEGSRTFTYSSGKLISGSSIFDQQ